MNNPPPPENQPPDPGSHSEQVRMQHVTARVPERVSRGMFSTGVIVMTGGTEFILDFLQALGKPRQVAARVVMPHAALPQFIDALRKNLELYTQRFGQIHQPITPPQDPNQQRPTVQEIYDDLKLPDDVLSGAYANGVMISHAQSEFGFDFLTNFFPHSAVSCRVYLAAPQVPRLLDSLQNTFNQFQQRVREQQRNQQNPPPPGPEDDMG
ncbi:MAG: DUF3467 domain-containing protein [Planctomycetes bacterium]|nr:DUF3467 domain-containing protein [Planctomycetota bacterium]